VSSQAGSDVYLNNESPTGSFGVAYIPSSTRLLCISWREFLHSCTIETTDNGGKYADLYIRVVSLYPFYFLISFTVGMKLQKAELADDLLNLP
jgi:hypothetical protein